MTLHKGIMIPASVQIWEVTKGKIVKIKIEDKIFQLVNETSEDKTIPEVSEKTTKNKKKYKKNRSPPNTTLFLNWLRTNKIESFIIKDFSKLYSYISEEQTKSIVSHQISKGNLLQTLKDGKEIIIVREGKYGWVK